MYKIEFYENQHGESEVWDFLEALRVKSKSSKDASTTRLSSTLTFSPKTAPICQSISPTSRRRHLGTASRK